VCIQLGLPQRKSGERTQPVIEPYSLRRTRDGAYLLYGVKADTGEDRSYRVDRIAGATVTQRSLCSPLPG
jgi:predicted DNA-binding transcriptional regulator YafY